MANIANVINVLLNQGGALAQADNVNVVCSVTSDSSGPINLNNRTESYTDLASVGAAFGTLGATYAHASTFFGTSPNPVNAGGRFVAGYWEKNGDPEIPAITDGEFQINIESVPLNLAVLNFSSIVTIDDANTILNTSLDLSLAGTTSVWTGLNFIITAPGSGITSTIELATNGFQGGTYIGNLIALDSGSGAFVTNGADAIPATSEDSVTALSAILADTPCKGVAFIDEQNTDADILALASFAQANDVLIYDVFSNASNLETNPGNPVWDIKLASQTNYRMTYSKSNNRKLATSYMARMHTVNFDAENSALTMHLKTLNAIAESYSQTEIDKAKNVGLDIYTTIKKTPVVLSSGANDFTDNRYNLIAFVGDIEVDSFNVLKGTSTKIGQTTAGVNTLLDQLEKTTERYRRAGVFAAGTWSSPDTFGDLKTFNRSIEANGYYWKASSLAEQSQATRENRDSPVFQGAVKAAGAIHSADIIINFNK
jgi:hypothetical protein